ncbi:hypothetical protein HPB47_012283 [Ixodes persulcatus]|uniref:Uncharacterized protein n=1 Tax=Ixodes persulcatus TaxID=34615 RepID=A0AC60NU24_IXOPE|nr:hypothetical protein HPB47_012283 [Ixodes persulcatus]
MRPDQREQERPSEEGSHIGAETEGDENNVRTPSWLCLYSPFELVETPNTVVLRSAFASERVRKMAQNFSGTSFEAREATSKITYDSRLRLMDRGRWAKRLFIYTYLTGVQTGCWRKRLYQLEKKYGFFSTPVTITSDRKWEIEIRNRRLSVYVDSKVLRRPGREKLLHSVENAKRTRS